MIRILLIRHANTELLGRELYGRRTGVHLSAEGRSQSQNLGQALKQRYTIAEVISSPLERALETARFIADSQGASIVTDEDINEIDFGSWMGKSFAELANLESWRQYNEFRSRTSPPGGEFMMQVQTRAWRALQKIVERYRAQTDATIALISHGDVIRALLILLLGMPLDHIHRIEVAPSSVSEILLGTGHPRVSSMNQVF